MNKAQESGIQENDPSKDRNSSLDAGPNNPEENENDKLGQLNKNVNIQTSLILQSNQFTWESEEWDIYIIKNSSSSCLELKQTSYNTKNSIFRPEISKIEEINQLYRQVVHLIESNFIVISNKEFSWKIIIYWSSSINAFKFSGDQIEYKIELWDKAQKKVYLKKKN